MAQHQSQCSIFANQQLKVSNIFLCSCCFRPTATWLSFRCWPTLINSFTDCFHWAKLLTFFRKFCNSCSASKTKFLQWLDPRFFVPYFIHNQSYYWLHLTVRAVLLFYLLYCQLIIKENDDDDDDDDRSNCDWLEILKNSGSCCT